ncbi:MAG: TonB-dependent receptor plug domain-containing protein, partial [Bacteriovoracaceae bacterium]
MKYLFLLLPVFAFSQTYQLEKIVIGSKRGLSEDVFSTYTEAISDFSSAGNRKALDVLEQMPGVSVNQSGAPGQQAFIHIRGSEARHVLVLIDGIRVNDPSSVDKSFNAALLNVGDIEKIEVLKGSQTLLYGSEAMGGVVNIITKKASAKNFVSAHAGFSRGFNLDHTLIKDNSILRAHFFHDQSEGVSAAAGGSEKDGFQNKGATLNLSRQFSEKFEGEWTYKVMDQFVETDTVDMSEPVDAQDDYSKSIQQVFSQKLNYNQEDSRFSYLLGANKMNRFNKSFGSVVGFNAFEFSNELQWQKNIESGSFTL